MNLRTRFERFCYKHRDKGIPNLMLYIAIGNAIVGIMSMINGGGILYQLLCFDKNKILQGEVWRLFSYVFTQRGSSLISLLFMYFFYLLGRQVELNMGTFKFNLYYLTGVVIMDVFAMIFCPIYPDRITSDAQFNLLTNVLPQYVSMAMYLHMSLLITFAAMYPDSEFRIMFIIPVKGWVIGLLDVLLTLISVINLSFPVFYFPHNLFPLVALANIVIFMGKDVLNLCPYSWRVKRRSAVKKAENRGPIPFRKEAAPAQKPNYSHRCTVCGRTDVSNPELEFRYCSRCNGYYCYCQEHIGNHTHIE